MLEVVAAGGVSGYWGCRNRRGGLSGVGVGGGDCWVG